MRYQALAICLAVGSTTTAAFAGQFSIVAQTQQQAGDLLRTKYVVQNGDNPLNRFGVERVVLAQRPKGHPVVPLILEPPLSGNANFYTFGNAPGGADFENSPAAVLAESGVDVFIYSPRESLLTAGQCAEQSACALAADWGFAAILDDLKFVRKLADNQGEKKPVIGGASLGGSLGLAAINEDHRAYSGLLLLDSPLATQDATLRAGYQILCDQFKAGIAAGQVVTDSDSQLARTLVALELTAPNDPSPFPNVPPGATNRQVYLLALTSPLPPPPGSLFRGGSFGVIGSVVENRLFFASESRINTGFNVENIYTNFAVERDITCSLAGDRTFTANLGKYKRPILSFEMGKGFSTVDDEAIALTRSRDVDVMNFPDFGHSDLINSADHAQKLEAPIVKWINEDIALRNEDDDE